MKKVLFEVMSVFALAALTCACNKNEDSPSESVPVVSITSDSAYSEEGSATLTLKLSQAASSDVKISLAKADVQSGKTEVPADYDKSVTIAKGQTTATVSVVADVLGLDSGEYQTAIRIDSADGATIADGSVVYINLSYAFKPEVNVYADAAFASSGKATVRVALSKATTKDVNVTLAAAEGNQFAVSIEPSSLSIAAGQTEAVAELSVTIPSDIATGTYKLGVEITGVENAVMGKVTSAEIGLTWPFAVNITIDGDMSDWDDPAISRWTLPDGIALYPMISEMRLTGNEKYVYMYFEFTDPGKVSYYCANAKEVVTGGALADNSLPIDIFIDKDGDVNTGAYCTATDNDTYYPPYANDNMGIEWYIEGAFHGGGVFTDFTSLTCYKYGGEDKANVFSGLSSVAGTYTGSEFYGVVNYDEANGKGQAEVQFSRAFFGITGEKARFSIKLMDMARGWACMGLLPQEAATDMNNYESRALGDMACVTLTGYVE